tara:strand:+ start:1947 stop:2393 length:447 start_codon:yes stop_codon:yes gene_type:complete
MTLFPITNDILDIIKEKYWKIIHKEKVLKHMNSEWRERRPYKKLYEMCRPGVNEGRVFLKGKNVGALIDGRASEILYGRRNNYYINGIILEKCLNCISHRYGMEFPSKKLFNIIDPISGKLIKRPSKEERIKIINYYKRNEGSTINYG